MNIYYNTKFKGHYPVGTAAIVVALNAGQAAVLLKVELERRGLNQVIYAKDMVDLSSAKNTQVIILNDGNY